MFDVLQIVPKSLRYVLTEEFELSFEGRGAKKLLVIQFKFSPVEPNQLIGE